jgi:hypothetical protein
MLSLETTLGQQWLLDLFLPIWELQIENKHVASMLPPEKAFGQQ